MIRYQRGSQYLILLAVLSQILPIIDCETVLVAPTCNCTEVLNQKDCIRLENCEWNESLKKCAKQVTQVTTPITYISYCGSILESKCSTTLGCQWTNSTCSFFTACSAHTYATDESCKKVASICFSDGQKCVDKDNCQQYKNQKSCFKNTLSDEFNNYCYWNTGSIPPICEDADTCDKLPKVLTTDEMCRAEIKTCTALSGGGCVQSGLNCSDQKLEIQCVWDINMTQKCYWVNGSCKDRTCNNASVSAITDEQCKLILSTCTTKQGGGCTTRASCLAATIQAACVKNSSGQDCYWTGTNCVDKTCQNAPTTYSKNSQCVEFQAKCIVKSAGGCIDNDKCSTSDVEESCIKNALGMLCIWNNNKCNDKTCINAPSSNNTLELCSNYLPTCTVNSTNTGCLERTCENAPSSLKLTSDCSTFFPDHNCITKLGGGCQTNTTCDAITIDIACIKDIQGKDCFWNNGLCRLKICENAPEDIYKQNKCGEFLQTCTLNKEGNKCIERTCSNQFTEAICKTDASGLPCLWQTKCFKKTCSNAPDSLKTHSQCNSYLSTCTVKANGIGCIELSVLCSAYTTAAQCVIKMSGANLYCGWTGKECMERNCLTAIPEANYTSTIQCQGYLNGCVVQNDGNGCMELPQACSGRLLNDNCSVGTSQLCVWQSTQCVQKQCSTATGSSYNTNSVCTSYLQGCITNSTVNGCIPKPNTCAGLIQVQCTDGASTIGDCYWNNTICVNKQCSNLVIATYTDSTCKLPIAQCTVNSAGTGCMVRPPRCSENTTIAQCVTNEPINGTSKGFCQWTGVACRDRLCLDSPNTVDFNTPEKCNGYLSSCTVASKVNGQGCITKSASCTDLIQSQCFSNSSGSICVWNDGGCVLKASITSCTQIKIDVYSNDTCSAMLNSCKVNANQCQAKLCADQTQANLTYFACQNYLSSCSVNRAETACVDRAAKCVEYTDISKCAQAVEGACFKTTSNICTLFTDSISCNTISLDTYSDINCSKVGVFCKANVGATGCEFNPCQNKIGTDLTFSSCQTYFKSCSVNSNGSACLDIKSTCVEYTDNISCVQAKEGSCFMGKTDGKCQLKSPQTLCTAIKLVTYNLANCQLIMNSCMANSSSDGCQLKTCPDKTGVSLTYSDCQQWLSCSVNASFTACVYQEVNCFSYTELQCYRATQGLCYVTKSTQACLVVSDITTCSNIKLSQYTDQKCQAVKQNCRANTANDACESKTCAQLVGSNLTYQQCQSWLSSCSVNATGTACIIQQGLCSNYMNQNDCNTSTQGPCAFQFEKCVPRSCETSDITLTSHSQCEAYLASCTVAKIGQCVPKMSTCEGYITQSQCITDLSNNKCYWRSDLNPPACMQLICGNLPQIASFNTHQACNSQLSTCTVKANNAGTEVSNGCIILQKCTDYKIQDQCFISSVGTKCVWNMNIPIPVCSDIACNNAPKSLFTKHEDCFNYVAGASIPWNKKCTISSLGGCDVLASSCTTYTLQTQCVYNNVGTQCDWNGSQCFEKSCQSANPANFTNHLQCYNYITILNSQCTVGVINSKPAGCILLSSCSSYQFEFQCVINQQQLPCFWNKNSNLCFDKSCTNAPDTIQDAAGCAAHLSECTYDAIQCKNKQCEDFQLMTDKLCSEALPSSKCTSNGKQCVPRGSCEQALTTIACTTDISKRQCTWIITTGFSYCTLRLCANALNDLKTEADCNAYLLGCTTKNGGGCIVKSECSSAKIDSACTTSITGQKCQWSGGACRNQDCQDYIGNSNSECQKIQTDCIADGSGRCMKNTQCAFIKNRNACLVGLDGPCLWVSNSCYAYLSCKSLTWKTDSQCKNISKQCTTDGTSCIGITKCNESNINGGCVTGSDGECIKTVAALGSKLPPICKLFSQCSDAYYITHIECQSASRQCTAGTSSCIPLNSCASYLNKESCVLNNIGATYYDDGGVKSTGFCVWDSIKPEYCRDQKCSDIKSSTESECKKQLAICTTNGTSCMDKANCSGYTKQTICESVVGNDGVCFWDSTKCRPLQCSDIKTVTSTSQCKKTLDSCVFDGTNCIQIANCATYTTFISCSNDGLDGSCNWVESSGSTGKCTKITACGDTNNQVKCQALKRSCFWSGNSCIPHTCKTRAEGDFCLPVYELGEKEYTICQSVNGVCTQQQVKQLKGDECFSLTLKSYTYDEINQVCKLCNSKLVTIDPVQTNAAYLMLGLLQIFIII